MDYLEYVKLFVSPTYVLMEASNVLHHYLNSVLVAKEIL